jgi:hypothetical protein
METTCVRHREDRPGRLESASGSVMVCDGGDCGDGGDDPVSCLSARVHDRFETNGEPSETLLVQLALASLAVSMTSTCA